MLAIPPVKCLAGLGDTSALLSSLVNQNMCPEEFVKSDVANLEQYRIAATSVSEPSESGQQHLIRYCQQLRHFVPRFVGLEPQFKLTFTWGDAFGINLKASSSSFYLDFACCLWNLASFESLMGARLDRTSEEGLRSANKHFQQAAGYLEYIRANILPNLPPLGNYPCLSEDGLNMVKNLMLAQGQLCFYEKAVKDKKNGTMKASIVAKLAKQTSTFYHTTSVACKVGVLGSMLDISWFAVTDFQSKCFAGAAEYWQAHASKEAAQAAGTGYGEEVARFNRAETLVGLALAQTTKFPISETLTFGANGLKAAIQQHRQTAEHDLRTVYMESVPNDYSLAEVGSVAMVRPSPLPEITEASNYTPLFRYVLPQRIREANTKYTEDISGLLQRAGAAAESATNAARTALSAKGLPGSLEAAKTEDPLPPSLWSKVQRVQAMGGSARLNTMFEDLKSVARRTLQSMATIDESLEREERTDQEFRQLNPDFPGTSSKVLNADVRSNNQRMREAYSNAQQSDKQTEADLLSEGTVEQLAIVSKTREELLKLFPRDAPNLLDYDEHLDKPVEGPEITRLEDKLHDLAALIETRGQEIATLRQIVNVDIVEATNAALAKGQDVATLHASNIGIASDLLTQVTAGVTKQDALLAEIMTLNDVFVRNKLTNPLAIERNKVIQVVEQSVAKFSLIHSQITAGITFYTSLQSKLTTLMQSTDDLAYTQQWQRQDYGAQKSSEMERTTQELADRDFALKLSNELAAASAPAVNNGPPQGAVPYPQPGAPGQAPAPHYGYQGQPQSAPQQAQAAPAALGPSNTQMVYGTPVSGPPPNLVSYNSQQMQQPPRPPPAAVPQPYMSTLPAAVPGGPLPMQAPPQAHNQQPQYQQQQQYQQQYQQYGNPAPQPPQNPGYNPYAAAPAPGQAPAMVPVPVPAGQYPLQGPPQQAYQQQQPQYQQPPAHPAAAYAPAPQPSPYGAYPAMPQMVGQPQAQPQQAAPGGYQYNGNNYSVAPQPGQQQQAPAPMNPAELHAKTMRLCEMGFPADQVSAALQANSGNEEAALNSLLAGPAPSVHPPAGPAGGAPPAAAGAPGAAPAAAEALGPDGLPVKPVKPSGLFGRMWGAK